MRSFEERRKEGLLLRVSAAGPRGVTRLLLYRSVVLAHGAKMHFAVHRRSWTLLTRFSHLGARVDRERCLELSAVYTRKVSMSSQIVVGWKYAYVVIAYGLFAFDQERRTRRCVGRRPRASTCDRSLLAGWYSYDICRQYCHHPCVFVLPLALAPCEDLRTHSAVSAATCLILSWLAAATKRTR